MPEPGSDKREAILKTALSLFVERGFFGTPTSLISREAGVATGTLFFYFRTKEELIDTLYLQVKAKAAEAMCRGLENEKDTKARLNRLGHNAVAWGMKNKEEVKFMEQFAHSPFVSTSAQEEGMSRFVFLQDLVTEGIREGVIRDYDPQLLVYMMASSLSGLIGIVAGAGSPAEREAIIDQGLEFVWNGLTTGPAGEKKSRKQTAKK
jgi:AcrR family transcriptional regulator